jgi:hypothetical protein
MGVTTSYTNIKPNPRRHREHRALLLGRRGGPVDQTYVDGCCNLRVCWIYKTRDPHVEVPHLVTQDYVAHTCGVPQYAG